MNDSRATRGPNWGLLLLIPAAVIVAKGAMRRRAMWEAAWASDPSSAGHPSGHGHHGRFAAGRGPEGQPPAFRLPPKIEWMLDTWHTRAHEATATADTAVTAGAAAAPDASAAPDPKDTGKPTTD